MYVYNSDGPMYGPNGELELDPDIPTTQCSLANRPVFATCKNNCPGGEFYIRSHLFFSLEKLSFYFQLISRSYQVRPCDKYIYKL